MADVPLKTSRGNSRFADADEIIWTKFLRKNNNFKIQISIFLNGYFQIWDV